MASLGVLIKDVMEIRQISFKFSIIADCIGQSITIFIKNIEKFLAFMRVFIELIFFC